MANEVRISVILDTNVFVAAYWNKNSASAKLIQASLNEKVIAYYSEEIKQEIIRTLRQIKASDSYLAYIDEFWQKAQKVKGRQVDFQTEDFEDQKFLEAAAGGEADYLITSDDHLLKVKYIGRTEILKPGTALKILGL